jgi:nucleotide-binding universal stress UspA family protein
MTIQTHHRSAEHDSRPVVVGYDGSPAAGSALDRSLSMASALEVSLQIIGVWQYPTVYGGYPLAGWTPEQDMQTMIDGALRERFEGDVPSWVGTSTPQGGAAQTLIEASRDAQMLVVGSRGHGGFAGLLLGSVSSACAEHASCPVLVMHAPLIDHDNAIDAGAEALGDGSRAADELAGASTS